MLKTISRFTSSFAALLADQDTAIDSVGRMEDIRTAMLDALSELDGVQQTSASRAWADIARASDVQALWYLRSDVLRLLADFYGELVARKRLHEITELFRGIVPKNQMPTPNRMQR